MKNFKITGLVPNSIGLVWLVMLIIAQSTMGEIIPSARRTTWQPGVKGGIPNRTQIFATMTAANTVTDINNAIANCPSNQVVFLSAGTYNLSGTLTFNNKRGVTLRGAGPGQTIINFSGGSYASVYFIGPNLRDEPSAGPDPTMLRNWTGGYAQGTTDITLDSTSGLTAGTLLVLDQLNDNLDVDNHGSEGCPYCSRSGGSRAQQQYVRVQAVNGNTVTISPGISMPNWSASLSPQAYWWGNCTEMCGIEDVTIDNTASSATYGVAFLNSYNCWVKNIRSLNADMAHVETYQAARIEVRHSTFYGTKNAASQSYGILWYYTSDDLCEDNVFDKVVGAIVQGAASSGCVNAYNYSTNMYYTVSSGWMIGGLSTHAAHNAMNLFEGNHANAIYMDFIHGSGSHNTALRNRLVGWEPGKTGNTFPIVLEAMNHYGNFVGNILGLAGYHTSYEGAALGQVGSATVYVLGYYTTQHNLTGYDARVASTILRHGNYDYATRLVKWDSSIPDLTIPASYYLQAKPTWFGDRPWPPFDPANPSSAAVTNLPAGYRYIFGSDPPAGLPGNLPPIGAIAAAPKSGVAPLLVIFSSLGSLDPEGVALTYSWSFGDGSTSTAANPTHSYQTDGTYVATLTVSDGANPPVAVSTTINVGNQPPVAVASASPTAGAPPLSVTFSSTGSSDPEGVTLSYSWNFGDGSAVSTAAQPVHIYQNAGTYVAKLTVSDGVKTTVSTPLSIGVINPASALVAAYSFDEGTGSTVADLSGNGNVGTISGATWATGKTGYGNALSFGTGAMVTVNDSASLGLTTGMTLEAWVRPTALPTRWSDIIYKAQDIYFLMGTTPQGQAPDMGGTFASGNVYGPAPLPLNTWSHLAGTYDGATMRFYLNSVLVGTRPQSGAIAVVPGLLSIGGDAANGQYWTGLIDEVRIYNRAISQDQIHTDMSKPLGSPASRPGTNSPARVVSN